MARLFGTDGVRGIANKELTCSLAYRIGKAATQVLSTGKQKKPLFLIGLDSRISGDMLQSAITAGILSEGGDVMQLGVLPTPGVAYLVRKYNAAAGIMISASHNPAEYNGIKIFSGNGFKLPDETEDEIERLTNSTMLSTSSRIGIIRPSGNAVRNYIDFLKSTVPRDFQGISIALDCANGATSHIAEAVFAELDATVCVTANEPNGLNINHNCGSTHPETICEFTKKSGSHIGISFDGDGDRVLFSDETGTPVDGDQILAILAKNMQKNGTLKRNTVVSTVMSNFGLTLFGEQNGIHIKQTNVGDRYVLEKMLQSGYNLGGEQSGHIILLDHNTTGDGILTALQLVTTLMQTATPLSTLARTLTKLPQVLINARVKNENKELVLKNEAVLELVENITIKLFRKGRVLVRPSGTEPLFRVMIEGENPEEIQQYAKQIATLIEETFS